MYKRALFPIFGLLLGLGVLITTPATAKADSWGFSLNLSPYAYNYPSYGYYNYGYPNYYPRYYRPYYYRPYYQPIYPYGGSFYYYDRDNYRHRHYRDWDRDRHHRHRDYDRGHHRGHRRHR